MLKQKAQPDQQPPTAPLQALKQFCRYTTAHGLGRFRSQTSAFGRTIWLTFLIGTYSGFAYHMYTLFDRFFSLPLLTTLTTSLAYRFPDVYICPTDALSISKLTDSSAAGVLDSLLDCDAKCKLNLLIFDIAGAETNPAIRRPRLNQPALALSDTLAAIETGLTHEFRFIMQKASSKSRDRNCRFTAGGEEYEGNTSTAAAVYSASTLKVLIESNQNRSAPNKQEPFLVRHPCLAWNEAAKRLDRVEGRLRQPAKLLAERIKSLNLSNEDNRCQQPTGLSMATLQEQGVATYSVRKHVGCLSRSFIWSRLDRQTDCFNHTTRFLSPESCQECCYRGNFTHMVLGQRSCTCGLASSIGETDQLGEDEDNTLFRPLQNSQPEMCSTICGGDNKGDVACGVGGNFTSLYRIRASVWKPVFIPFRPDAVSYYDGPFCFYNGKNGQISAASCNIPYCEIPRKYDCSISSSGNGDGGGGGSGGPGGSAAAAPGIDHFSHYTGSANRTVNARHCLAWSDVKRNLETRAWKIFASIEGKKWASWFTSGLPFEVKNYKVLNVHVDLPDYESSGGNGLCRSVMIVIETLYTLKNGSQVFYREPYLSSSSPGCFTQKYGYLAFENCEIEECYQTIPSVTATLRDSLGTALLARQFSSGLGTSLSKCIFGNRVCDRRHFVTMVHPEFGICHKFDTNAFDSTGTGAMSKLSIKYFSDKMDSFGYSYENTSKLAYAVRDTRHRSESQSALKVIVVPEGAYPWTKEAVPVYPGQHVELKLRFDKSTRYSRSPQQPCTTAQSSVTYRLESWPNNYTMDSLNFYKKLPATIAEKSWRKKMRILGDLLKMISDAKGAMQNTFHFPLATRSDCINDYIVNKFIENCNCLPSGLPVQLKHFENYTYCFNETDSHKMFVIEACYQAQMARILQYNNEALNACLPQCETQRYSIRQSSHPWPNMRRESAVKFLKVLAELHGYPDQMRATWGESALYYMYERAAELVDLPSAEKMPSDWISFARQLEALQDQLAMVSVQGRQAFGEETFEEEAYPTKNLLADMGGALGLWSGVSVLTVCELIELCLYLVAAVRYRIAQPQSTQARHKYGEDGSGSPLRITGANAANCMRVQFSENDQEISDANSNI